MANLNGLATIVSELRSERASLRDQLRHVDAALSVLGKLDGGKFHTEPRRTLSAGAPKRISIAQKARWAKPKRTISASARRKIAAAQRANRPSAR